MGGAMPRATASARAGTSCPPSPGSSASPRRPCPAAGAAAGGAAVRAAARNGSRRCWRVVGDHARHVAVVDHALLPVLAQLRVRRHYLRVQLLELRHARPAASPRRPRLISVRSTCSSDSVKGFGALPVRWPRAWGTHVRSTRLARLQSALPTVGLCTSCTENVSKHSQQPSQWCSQQLGVLGSGPGPSGVRARYSSLSLASYSLAWFVVRRCTRVRPTTPVVYGDRRQVHDTFSGTAGGWVERRTAGLGPLGAPLRSAPPSICRSKFSN